MGLDDCPVTREDVVKLTKIPLIALLVTLLAGACTTPTGAETGDAGGLDAELELPTSDRLTFHLTWQPPMVIVVEAFDQTPHVTTHKVDAEMALETPGTYEDAVRLVQSLPGVAVEEVTLTIKLEAAAEQK